MKATILTNEANTQVVTLMAEQAGLLLQVSRQALDECAALGYSQDDERGLICERRAELDPDGIWISDRRGNGLRSFAVRVSF